MSDITKAIVPIAGLGTRFLPMSKVLPKEFMPVLDKPVLHYLVEELQAAGVTHILFVASQLNKNAVAEYFQKNTSLEKVLSERKQVHLLEELQSADRAMEGISFSIIVDKPLGDAHAVLQGKKFAGDDACFVVTPGIIESRTPCAVQLAQVFKTAQKPVMGLFKAMPEEISSFGIVAGEKIANRFYKIKKIVEKPLPADAPSDLAITGRRIVTPEVFDYIKKTQPNKKGEIVLTEAFGEMVKDGKLVYGYEFEGTRWGTGDKESWLKTHLHYTLKHPEFGAAIRKFLKEERMI